MTEEQFKLWVGEWVRFLEVVLSSMSKADAQTLVDKLIAELEKFKFEKYGG